MNAAPDIIHALRGQLLAAGGSTVSAKAGVSTTLALLDAFASATADGLASGAVHEVLADHNEGSSVDTFALLLASAVAAVRDGGWIVWSDPARTLYPPALARAGVAIDRLLLLRPCSPQEELWAIAECMRCAGVAATVARVGRLTPVQARRLQLAAEQGGGVGVFVRPDDARSANYAAATRWRVQSLAPANNAQRWNVELAYGHGGRVGQSLVLEVNRETGRAAAVSDGSSGEHSGESIAAAENSLRRAADLADRSRATAARRSSA